MNRVIALELDTPPNPEGLPGLSAWEAAQPVTFCSDWHGKHPDAHRETQVRLLWSHEFLFIRFLCRYRDLYVYEGSIGRRDELWLRDVAEVFIRPPGNDFRHYLEFEISPKGDWLDLDIAPGKKTILFCDLKSRVLVDSGAGVWSAELAIPFDCMTAAWNPEDVWSLNLFRIEGREPRRFYSAWQPTYTPQPNFHIPEAFGELHFKNRG